jgi:tetratricopeptide (TPR) repeat protein
MRSINRDWLASAIIAAITIVVFLPALKGQFVNFDDYTYVSRNNNVLNGLSLAGVRWAFTTTRAANWHPLTWLSLQLDSNIWYDSKEPLEPFGYHLTNILLHSANAVLVFVTLRALTGAFWRSSAVALLFALHPLRVESVAWIAERKDVLSAFFGLVALRAYAAYVRKPELRRYLVIVIALALSLISKPMFVTLPFLLLVLDWWPSGRVSTLRNWQWLVIEKLPLIALVLVSSYVTYRVQELEGAVMAIEDSPPLARSANALISYAVYLRQTICPIGLAVLYPHPGADIPLVRTSVSSLLVVGITVAGAWLRKSAPYVLVGWLWFLGTLVPVIGLVQVGVQARADRYTYFPQIGILFAICWGIAALLRNHRQAAISLAAAAAVASMVMTSIQITYWRDSLTLWERAKTVSGENATTYANLGETLEEQKRLKEATVCYRKSVELAPRNVQGYINLGLILQKQNQLEEAAKVYSEIGEVAPNSPAGYTNLGVLYRYQKRYDEAVEQFTEASTRGSDEEKCNAFMNLGAVELERKNFERAEAYYRQAIALQPGSAQAYHGLGTALLRQKKQNAGLEALRQAIECNPGFEPGRSALGRALAGQGELDQAADQFEEMIRLNPKSLSGWYNLGLVRGQQKRLVEAANCFAAAVACDPRDGDSWRALEGTFKILRQTGYSDAANQIEQRVLPLIRFRSDAPSG